MTVRIDPCDPDAPLLLDLQVRQTAITNGSWKNVENRWFPAIWSYAGTSQNTLIDVLRVWPQNLPQENIAFIGDFFPNCKKRTKSRVERVLLLFRKKTILSPTILYYLQKIPNPKKWSNGSTHSLFLLIKSSTGVKLMPSSVY